MPVPKTSTSTKKAPAKKPTAAKKAAPAKKKVSAMDCPYGSCCFDEGPKKKAPAKKPVAKKMDCADGSCYTAPQKKAPAKKTAVKKAPARNATQKKSVTGSCNWIDCDSDYSDSSDGMCYLDMLKKKAPAKKKACVGKTCYYSDDDSEDCAGGMCYMDPPKKKRQSTSSRSRSALK